MYIWFNICSVVTGFTSELLGMLVPGQDFLEISLEPLDEQTEVKVDIMQPYSNMKYVNGRRLTKPAVFKYAIFVFFNNTEFVSTFSCVSVFGVEVLEVSSYNVKAVRMRTIVLDVSSWLA